ncbi:MAG TPA: hypothetical protein VFM69_05360 [Pricia sp.]|nr:hypothetical protein [Pricia sp.]
MKRLAIFTMAAIFNLNCNAQEQKTQKEKEGLAQNTEKPEGTWKVEKEFDEDGNLIRYDSIYSWSSDGDFEGLSTLDNDSAIESMRSKFNAYFPDIEEDFKGFFQNDSLFSERFFNEDFFRSEFGKDFMDLDSLHERLEAIQQSFLEKYQTEFGKPEKDSVPSKS